MFDTSLFNFALSSYYWFFTFAALTFQVEKRPSNQYVIQTYKAATIGLKGFSDALINVRNIFATS